MFAGLLRTLFYIVMVWFVWRWLDRLVGGGSERSVPRAMRGGPTPPRGRFDRTIQKKANTWTLKR